MHRDIHIHSRQSFQHNTFHICLCAISSMRNTRWKQKTTRCWTRTCRNEQKCTCICVYTHTPPTSVYYLPLFHHMCCSHTHPHLVLQLSVRFLLILLPPCHSNSQVQLFKCWSFWCLLPQAICKSFSGLRAIFIVKFVHFLTFYNT